MLGNGYGSFRNDDNQCKHRSQINFAKMGNANDFLRNDENQSTGAVSKVQFLIM